MKTTYKVTAATGFKEHKEGEEFEAELDEGLEQRAVKRGQLRVVKRHETKSKGKEKDSDG